MAMVPITSKPAAQALLDNAYVLVTQPAEQADGTTAEALRRIPLSVFFAEIYDARIDNPDEEGNPVDHASLGEFLRELSKKVAEAPDGGVGFSDWKYDTTTMYLHLYDDEGLDVLPPVYIPGGGGSSTGSQLTFAMQTATSMAVAKTATEANITYILRSVDATTQVETGNATLQIYVGGTLKKTLSVSQGTNTVNVREYLSIGANSVALTITDAYGTSATRRCTISIETLTLDWSLGNTESATGDLTFNLTPTGNYTKTVYILVDGEEYESFSVSTTGRRQTKTVTAQAHGGHIISAYCTMDLDGTLLTSKVLTCAVAWVSDTVLPAIACNTVPAEIAQYTTVNLVHRVIDPQNNPTMVEYLVDDVVYKSESVDQSEQTWSYRVNKAGSVKLGIKCGDAVHSVTITVTSIGSDIEEITDGLQIKVEPTSMTSLKDWAYGEYSLSLSDNFDEVNGGLVNDADGIRCIRITAGDRLTINYPLFSGDARKNGLAAKLIYAVKDSSSKETVAISCLYGGIGLEIKANNAYLRGNQTTITLSTCEDMKTELDFNIQPDSEDGLMYMMEKASTFSYQKYATDESFAQTSAQGITLGSDDADVYLYLFRAYNRDLTNDEIKANFIADGADADEILTRKDRNNVYDSTGNVDPYAAAAKNPDAHVIIINAERMTLGKKDGVTGTIQHIKGSGEAEHQFTADTTMYVQGTSSVEHADTAGPNINFYFPNGIKLEDGTVLDGYAMNGTENSIPVSEITFKKNIASQDHIVNRASAEWYNRFQPSVRAARQANSKVRDCLESTMCIVFFHNTGTSSVRVGPDTVAPDSTIFFGLGNICNNKDSANAFEYDPIVIEVRNNTEPQVRFKSNDLTGSNFGNNYEFRFLDTAQFTEDEAKAEWQKVQNFIYETDYTAATGAALSAAVTFNGVTYTTDSAAYRKARWYAEAPTIFDMDTLYWHHNITLFLLLRDNRAKNMFWSYNPTTKKWGLWFNWDNDTGLCRNNEGYVDIEPGYMDFDTLGTSDVFNAADNALFTNLRECNATELQQSYIDRESAGAWNIDAFYAYVKESQDSICESLWMEDAQHNAIRTMQNLNTTAYLARSTGKLQLHIKKALMFQKVLVDSYYNATACTSDSAAFRGYTPSEWVGVAPSGLVDMVAYTDMYINILAGSTPYKQRAKAGEVVTFDMSAHLNDTEIYFRNAAWIQAFGDLSGLYLGQFEASKLIRVRKLLIGSSVDGYYNTNFESASFDNCKKLEELNMGGLTNAASAYDFSPNIYLKKLYTKGSGITGITFAKKGRIEEAYLNAVSSLYMNGLHKLEVFEMESCMGLTSLTVENCPSFDSYNLVSQAVNLNRVRLIDVDWVSKNAETLIRLISCGGKDDSGYDADNAVLTGNSHIGALSQTKLDKLKAAFPDLEIVYDEITSEWHLRFWNDDKTVLLDEQLIEHGYGGENPVTRAVNPIATPTKESTAYLTYSFAGWLGSYTTIIQDTDILAKFTEATRQYTVTWMNGLDVVQRLKVDAAGSAVYTGADLEKVGYIWVGWDTVVSNVLSDLVVNAIYEIPELPTEKLDTSLYDFVYSDDPADTAAYTFGQLVGIIESGLAGEYFNMYDKVKIVNVGTATKDETIILSLHSLGHFELADDSGELAKTTWFMEGVLVSGMKMRDTNTNVGGYFGTIVDTWLENTLLPSLPCHWRSVIKPVYVLANAGDQSVTINKQARSLYLPCWAELGIETAAVPYKNEVVATANEIQFSKYTSNNQRIKKTYNGEGSAQNYWTRSAYAGSSVAFCLINYTGVAGLSNYGGASNSDWLCVGLSI